jgi:hypothetical protein
MVTEKASLEKEQFYDANGKPFDAALVLSLVNRVVLHLLLCTVTGI